MFNRGTHAPPPTVTALRGERAKPGGLAALERGEWDVVVDTWSWAPSAVRDAATLLAGRAGHYVYVSPVRPHLPVGGRCRRGRSVVAASADDGDDVGYARFKAGGELAAVAAFGSGRCWRGRG